MGRQLVIQLRRELYIRAGEAGGIEPFKVPAAQQRQCVRSVRSGQIAAAVGRKGGQRIVILALHVRPEHAFPQETEVRAGVLPYGHRQRSTVQPFIDCFQRGLGQRRQRLRLHPYCQGQAVPGIHLRIARGKLRQRGPARKQHHENKYPGKKPFPAPAHDRHILSAPIHPNEEHGSILARIHGNFLFLIIQHFFAIEKGLSGFGREKAVPHPPKPFIF